MSQSAPHVCVVGGGLVGISFVLSLRRALSAQQLRISLIESFPMQLPERSGGPSDSSRPLLDMRSTALSWGTREISARLGIWEDLEALACPIESIHVSEQGQFGVTRMHAAESSVPALGYVIENAEIGRSLLQALAGAGDITLHAPCRVTRAEPSGSGYRVLAQGIDNTDDTDRAVELDADLLVVCDGGKSSLCAENGIHARTVDYQQHALVLNVASDTPHANVAYERFTEQGPMALLPLPGDSRAVICTLPPDLAAHYSACAEADLVDMLQSQFGKRLGRIAEVGQRSTFPLSLEVIDDQARPGLVVLGNAAHTLHPVAGQGFNLSMRDAEALVRAVRSEVALGGSPGSLAALTGYLKQRSADQQGVIGFTHALTRVFGRQMKMLGPVRSSALMTLDLLSPARKLLARHAMGVA